MIDSLTLLGFGEAGSTFARAAGWGAKAIAFDIATERTAVMAKCGVRAAASGAEAVGSAPLVLSLVTADQAEAVAREQAPFLASGALWCDMNSVAPQTKRAAASVIEAAGGRYVDVGVLAAVDARMAVPLLLAGAAAHEAEVKLRAAGFSSIRVVGEEVGRASAIKMIRSVMVKGIEALTAEMMLAAEAAGVTDEVLASLDASEKPRPWADKAAYNLERMTTHGLRRAAEMGEVTRTLAALGISSGMSEATVGWQQAMGELGLDPSLGPAERLAAVAAHGKEADA